MSVHPIMAQALKPFAAPIGHGNEAMLLRTLLCREQEQLASLLRLPLMVDVSSDPYREQLVEADTDVVTRATYECIERHAAEINDRVAELMYDRTAA